MAKTVVLALRKVSQERPAPIKSAKGIVRLMASSASVEFAPDNIHLNSSSTSMFDTHPFESSVSKEAREAMTEIVSMKYVGKPVYSDLIYHQ